MSDDLIKRSDAIKALHKHFSSGFDCVRWWNSATVLFALNSVPSADRPSAVDLSSVYSTAYKSGYEKGKADGAMIYGNEHNCVMTIFGECSYAETGCGDCAVVEKVRKALSADRPQGYWTKTDVATYRCSECGKIQIADDVNELNFCCCCGSRNKVRRCVEVRGR